MLYVGVAVLGTTNSAAHIEDLVPSLKGGSLNVLIIIIMYTKAASALQTGFNANSRIRFESTSNPLRSRPHYRFAK